MARLILKAPYYKPRSKVPSGASRGGYANYIATREGVEILPRGGMVGYIGERRGSHGLFSDDGVDVTLAKISKEMDEHQGNIWGLIFSLTREDAERLGYNQVSQWVSLLRSHRNDIAREMHISPHNLRWYAAYHNAEGHPHVHMLVWSSNPHEPYLSTVGIHNIKKAIAADIFRQDNISNYKKQTQARDDLKEQFRIRIAEINREIQSGSFSVSEALVQKLEELSLSLEKHKGKKVYGYLSKKNKDMVDEIVKMVARDKKITELYDLWYQLQCENYRNYTDQMPVKIPPEANKEFKSLRNFVVRSASEMITDIPEPSEFDDDYLYHRKYGDKEIVLKFKAEDGYPHEQYLYARVCLENDDPEEAEHWLKNSASKGNRLAMYMLYKCYRDGKIEDRENDKMKYLLMAVDKEYGFAEYEYSKILSKTKSDMAIEYMRQASRHGCPVAEYAIGKLFLERGNTDLALPYLERAASKNTWARFYLGLLYYYKLDDKDKGMEYLRMAEEQNFEPARAAITQIQYNYNARIVAGVFNLFYYASRIIDEDAEDMYPHPAFADVDMRAKREDRAKRMGLTMGGM